MCALYTYVVDFATRSYFTAVCTCILIDTNTYCSQDELGARRRRVCVAEDQPRTGELVGAVVVALGEKVKRGSQLLHVRQFGLLLKITVQSPRPSAAKLGGVQPEGRFWHPSYHGNYPGHSGHY